MKLPRSIWALGIVSLCMDMSSEMIHALLPIFLVGTLGVSALALGVIEGIAEATASISKIFSGVLSDRWGKRKPLIVLGYGMAALTKPLFPLADSALTVFTARFLDRIGKGIRGAPRDALVADVTAAGQRGAAYGLRQSMDTVGAFAGPLIAIGLMAGLAFDIRAVFWVACIPALFAVAVLIFGVKEPPNVPKLSDARSPLAGFRASDYPKAFWALVGLVLMFTLMRFSEAFLVLRAQDAGLSSAWIPLTLVVMSATYLLTAYPAGKLSDYMSRYTLLAVGCVVMLAADLLLAFSTSLPGVMAGIALWGVHMGLTEGLIAALVADHAPEKLRGSAFGVINLARGVMALLASVLAGGLWTWSGPTATFATGAGLAVITALAALSLRPRRYT
ncbi:MAG: MFS transporter [Gammaproteobacteria bacterium]|nr:MFS transporter [Gammaproteobacteria bacterium]